MDASKIGARIKATREELGYTQKDLAEELGFNKLTMQRYESGEIKKNKNTCYPSYSSNAECESRVVTI